MEEGKKAKTAVSEAGLKERFGLCYDQQVKDEQPGQVCVLCIFYECITGERTRCGQINGDGTSGTRAIMAKEKRRGEGRKEKKSSEQI